MALGQGKGTRTYLYISHGKIVMGTGNSKKYYTFIEGCIEGIYTKHSRFGDEDVVRWYIDIIDGEESYSICFPYGSGVFKSVVLSLASLEDFATDSSIRIQPYEKKGYTKVVVYADGQKLNWVENCLPPQDIITIGEKQIKDDTKQMEYISSLCAAIMERMKKNSIKQKKRK